MMKKCVFFSCFLLGVVGTIACSSDDDGSSPGAAGAGTGATSGSAGSGGATGGSSGDGATGGSSGNGGTAGGSSGSGGTAGGSSGSGGTAGGGAGDGGNAGAAGSASGGTGGNTAAECAMKSTKSECDYCCNKQFPSGADQLAQHMAACLCQPVHCQTKCAAFCADPANTKQLSNDCMACYTDSFQKPAYQQCWQEEDKKCSADPTCSAFGECITSCIDLS